MPLRSRIASLFVLALAVAAPGSRARADITFDVKATVAGEMGNPVTIGSIKASLTYTPAAGFYEKGVFTFANAYNKLDDCYEFRWFQIITALPEAVRTAESTKFKDAMGNYTRTPTVPFVDPPAGGYKYQQAGGGADNDPFYENSGNGMYAYPNYSARHTQNVESWTDDAPGPEDVYFETYLVVSGGDIGANKFCVLAGYSWNTHLTMGAVSDPVQIAAINLNTLNTALDNSGFATADGNKWTAIKGCTLTQCPEPSSLAMAALGGLGLWGARRRRRHPELADAA